MAPRRHSGALTWARVRPLVLALAAVGLVVGALLALHPAPEGVPVVVARRTLTTGAALTREDVRVVLVPREARPEDALAVDEALPPTWAGQTLPSGTVLTETNLAGSAMSRALAPGFALVVVNVGADQVHDIAVDDRVDVWAPPTSCDETACTAVLLAEQVRIASVVVEEDPSWGSAAVARVGLVLRADGTDRVLGHSGTGMLSLVLRPVVAGSGTTSTGDDP